jgi:hypothetical protein
LKAVTMIMVTAIAFFWSFMGNPAYANRSQPHGALGSSFFGAWYLQYKANHAMSVAFTQVGPWGILHIFL